MQIEVMNYLIANSALSCSLLLVGSAKALRQKANLRMKTKDKTRKMKTPMTIAVNPFSHNAIIPTNIITLLPKAHVHSLTIDHSFSS